MGRGMFGIAMALSGFAAAMLLVAQLVPVRAAEAPAAPAGATSCTGCHPANANVDTPVPRLAGQDAAEMVAALQAFRSGRRPATVMDRIAKGFSDDEIKSIAEWYAAQR